MTEPLLRVRNLSARYGTSPVLVGIDLTIGRGDWFALLGPNGSGKTTLLRCLSAQLMPDGGDNIHIGGHSLLSSPQEAKRLLGYAHPPEQLPGLLTGRQCLEVYAAARSLPDIGKEILDLLRALRLAAVLDQLVDTYSLGMRQKLSAVLALLGDPALVVLDEVFNGFDPAGALILKRHLQERVLDRRCGVLLATHALDIVLRYATHAALLLDGRLAKHWDAAQLESMRMDGADALELALATSAEGAG